MPKLGETLNYSTKAGHSGIPIREGYVIRLHRIAKLRNRGLGGERIYHDIFLWITRICKVKKGQQPKNRPVIVVKAYIPQSDTGGGTPIIRKRVVQRDTLVLYLREGYDIIARDIFCHHTDQSYKNFYKAIGLWREE